MPRLKIKPVFQRDEFDCGAAVLEMLIRFHGGKVPSDLLSLCCPQDGLQPDAVKAVLQRQWGHYTSSIMTLGILGGFVRDGKPVLCPLNPPGADCGHWVIVCGVGRRVHYVCPWHGEGSLSANEWLEAWANDDVFPCWGVTSWPY